MLLLAPDRPTLEWWNLAAGAVSRSVPLAGAPETLARGDLILAGDGESLICPDAEGVLRHWSTRDGRLLHQWAGKELGVRVMAENPGSGAPARQLRAAALSRTGRWLAVAPFGGVDGLPLDTRTGVRVRLQGHRDDLTALAFAPDDRMVASASVDGTIRLWEVGSGRSRGLLPGHLESVDGVAFSADGRTLVSTSVGVDVAFWHLATGRELGRIPNPEIGAWVRFSPEGERVAINLSSGRLETSGDRLEIWEGHRIEAQAVEQGTIR